MTKIAVKQEAEKEIPTEVLASSVLQISEGFRRLRGGRLNDRAVLLLVSSASGSPQYEVKKVLDGLESLEATFLRKKAAK